MTRRAMLLGTAGTLAIFSLFRWGASSDAAPAGKFEIEKSDDEWRKLLTPAQYDVLRKHGTERAGTSPLNAEKRKGTFACAGCDLPLFSSDTKYESGTGWPSFWQPLAERDRHDGRQVVLHDPHRGALPPLRRASGACVRGRPEADRSALLHQRRGAEVHARRGERAGVSCLPHGEEPTQSAASRTMARARGHPSRHSALRPRSSG